MNRPALEALYDRYNRREYVEPDPVQFLYGYDDPADREIVALIAAVLSFGRVAQILRSITTVLERMDKPADFLRRSSPARIRRTFDGFRHRFADGDDLAGLLAGAKRVQARHGSLQACFEASQADEDATVMPALTKFVDALCGQDADERNCLAPSPRDGSACKRWNLFLRWMVRRDDVDPGGWDRVSAAKLVVPLDTHMHRIGTKLGFTRRKQGDLRTAMEITDAFRAASPEDPVRYDFALTRLGIRSDTDMESFLRSYSAPRSS